MVNISLFYIVEGFGPFLRKKELLKIYFLGSGLNQA
jgi:hypothetical protein